jgi:hypothetical protein
MLRPYEAGVYFVFLGSPCLANLFTTETQSAQRTAINLSVSSVVIGLAVSY